MKKHETSGEEKLYSPELSDDPVTRFHQLAELRSNGLDPHELAIVEGNPITKKVRPPDRWVARQVSKAEAAGADWLEGVRSPSRDPIKAAIDAKDKFMDRLMAALKAGFWEKGLEKVSHSDIVRIVEALGDRVYTEAFAPRRFKIEKVVRELQPLVQSVSDAIQTMPDKTDADREKRLLTARRLMIEVGKKRRGLA